MTDEELSQLPAYRWMPSRIPLRDALSTFVPDAPQSEPIINEMSRRSGQSVWFPVEGGHRVLFLYDGEAFDASRFTLEPKAWDYNDCSVCGDHIPAMTPCQVTEPGEPYVLLCATCYQSYIAGKSQS